MDTKEIYLLTAFVCATCDGEIATEEVSLVKKLCAKSALFGELDVEACLNEHVASINKYGIRFINEFLRMLDEADLSKQEQLQVIKIAIDMIEADDQILYSEVKFFKRLRRCLKISDEEILAVMPDKEDYLLPDIRTNDFSFDDDIQFSEINLNTTM